MAQIVPPSAAGLDGDPSQESSPRFAWRNRPPTFGGGPAHAKTYAHRFVRQRLRDVIAVEHPELGLPVAAWYQFLADFVRDGTFETERIEVRDMHRTLLCKPITIKRASRDLKKINEVVQLEGGPGKRFARFALIQIAGPLPFGGTADRDLKDRGSHSHNPISQIEDGRETRSQRSRRSTANVLSEIETRADLRSQRSRYTVDTSLYSEEEENSTSADDRGQAEHDAFCDDLRLAQHTAHQFIAWWPVHYPMHNGGVKNRVRGCDRAAALSLAEGRTLERLQDMAIELWTVESDGDVGRDAWYIATRTDRSIRTLLEKETFIETRVLQRRDTDARSSSPSSNAASSRNPLVVHLERIRARLQDTSHSAPTILADALARAASELAGLPVEDDRDRVADALKEIAARIRDAARFADVDVVRHCELDAETELAPFRQTMSHDAYARALERAVDRGLCAHYRLPTIEWTGE